MRSLLALVLVAVNVLTATPAVAADTPPLVRVRSASRSLPMLAAVANGFFTAEGLNVDYAQFVSSKPTFIQVDQQEIEFIVSSMDNAINYQLNPNNPAGRILDNVIVGAHDLGLGLALTAAAGYPDAESLRGKRVGVDVPHSGFGLPAEKILQEAGLTADTDYTLVSAGSTPARYQGLLDGSWEAAIINAEGVVRARADGLPVIGTVAGLFDAYQGGVLAGNREWLATHRDVAVRFLRAYVRGVSWVFDRRHRDAAIALLVDAETTPELAAAIYDLNVAPDGLAPCGALSPTGFRTVLELRDEFHGFETPQDIDLLASPEGGLYDLSFYDQAVRR
ncbi:ABC transporter substrate-binding protein [Actinoplanes sp. NPDC051851]|uniref:ABC transporter substrate-binding protein n=1 Tax=Actinoplanes sp. NPDC051851 TaxID=3154753 RepID=UPI00342C90C2